MSDPKPDVVTWPSDEESVRVFEAYTLAVGKVAHAWNYLHEKLALLFCAVVRAEDRAVPLAIWYSTTNERAQRLMLRDAFEASRAPSVVLPKVANRIDRWEAFPKAASDFKWLDKSLDALSGARNNAIHAPCSLYVGGGDAGGSVMGAAFLQGHPRAVEIRGKRILLEFDWCERYAETLTRFVTKVESAIVSNAGYPWPSRPTLPSRHSQP
jgi:hypothetical protein